MKTAKLKNIAFDKQTEVITITIDAKDSCFSSFTDDKKKEGFPMLYNSAVLSEGVQLLLDYTNHGVDALKGLRNFDKDTLKLLKQVDSLLCNLQAEERPINKLRLKVIEKIIEIES